MPKHFKERKEKIVKLANQMMKVRKKITKMERQRRGKEHYQMFLMCRRYPPDLKQIRKRRRIMAAKTKSREKCLRSGSRQQMF